jgi:O-antigen/teichoic acid export membrane protein
LAEVMVGPGLREGAAQVTPWIAASAFLSGMTVYYFHTAFTLARRTKLLMAAMGLPAVVNLALNLALVPRFGLQGALWATLASYGLGALASYGLGRRVLSLPLPWQTLVKSTLAAGGMAVAVRLVPASGGVAELAAKAGIGGLAYGLLAVALNVADVRRWSLKLARTVQAKLA